MYFTKLFIGINLLEIHYNPINSTIIPNFKIRKLRKRVNCTELSDFCESWDINLGYHLTEHHLSPINRLPLGVNIE